MREKLPKNNVAVAVPLLDLPGWLDCDEPEADRAPETLAATESIHLTTVSGAGPSAQFGHHHRDAWVCMALQTLVSTQ